MNIRVKIINGHTNEGVHELTSVDGQFIWLYSNALQKLKVSKLSFTAYRNYLHVRGLGRLGLPFLEGDLEKIEWT